MGLQIGLPRVLDGGLESGDKHARSTESFSQLVGGEGLAEPHLRVPQKPWDSVEIFCPNRVVVIERLVPRFPLLTAHLERLMMGTCEPKALPQFSHRRFDVVGGATHPLARRADDDVLKS